MVLSLAIFYILPCITVHIIHAYTVHITCVYTVLSFVHILCILFVYILYISFVHIQYISLVYILYISTYTVYIQTICHVKSNLQYKNNYFKNKKLYNIKKTLKIYKIYSKMDSASRYS